MPSSLPSRRAALRAALALWPAGAAAQAAAWPSRPVRLVVAYPPGGVSDEIARALASELEPRLGVPVLVDHRAGAGGGVAMDLLARAPADGHTLCFSAVTPLTLSPHLGRVGYDPLNDIAPVASVMLTPVLVIGTTALRADSLAAMLALARAQPGRIRWATSGLGTTGHRVLEEVRAASGADITHVPYKGGGQQLTDALGGQFEVLSSNVGAVQLRHIADGRLKPLAVGAPSRLAVLPQVPTLAEAGFASANLASRFGVFAPGRTPGEVVARLNGAVNDVLRQAAFRDRLLAVNNLPTGGSAAAFTRGIAEEHEHNRRRLSGRPSD